MTEKLFRHFPLVYIFRFGYNEFYRLVILKLKKNIQQHSSTKKIAAF